MSISDRLWTGTGLLFVIGGGYALLYLALGLGPKASKSTNPLTPPATVDKIVKEDQFNHITLTPAAIDRLALKVGQVEVKSVSRVRMYGGEILVPVGRTIIVSAPLSGTLEAPQKGILQPGSKITKGTEVVRLLPLITPEGRATIASSQVDAEGLVKNAQSQLDATKIALDRAKQLLKDQAGSQRAVDEAQAAFDLAHKTLDANTARRDLLRKIVGELGKGTASPIEIQAPQSGIVRNVSALPGQYIPSGASLFEIVDLDVVWVRVPVYVGDLSELNTKTDALIGSLTGRTGDQALVAKPILAPPTANAISGTVDLYYELDNRSSQYRPNQRVGATLPLLSETENRTVPWSAVVHDIHGGTWVYEVIGERTYNRRRVIVQFVNDNTAVLAEGPPKGTSIVIAGVAEIFGTETGYSK
jgi:membrane fusion protein, heavy metal efflux system